MSKKIRIAGIVSLFVAMTTLLSAAMPGPSSPVPHERKEVAGLAIVFGIEPEPALTEEMQFLRWRVSSLADEKAYGDFTDAEVLITYDGEEFGPFPLRGLRGTPGQYQTRHIFTEVGEYETVLTFKKGEETEVHTVDFGFTINNRGSLEIPKKTTGS